MSQTKTPLWEREYSELTNVERCIVDRYAVHQLLRPSQREGVHTFAWSELCALQAVAEAVEKYLTLNPVQENVALAWAQIEAALKKWRAICPR